MFMCICIYIYELFNNIALLNTHPVSKKKPIRFANRKANICRANCAFYLIIVYINVKKKMFKKIYILIYLAGPARHSRMVMQ